MAFIPTFYLYKHIQPQKIAGKDSIFSEIRNGFYGDILRPQSCPFPQPEGSTHLGSCRTASQVMEKLRGFVPCVCRWLDCE